MPVGGGSQITILMDGDKDLEANFTTQVGLQIHVLGAGQVTGLGGGGLFQVGATATLQAIPAQGWEFAGWAGSAGW